jgi:uncharacterized membrane protein YagU involved in acid resistance
MKKYMLNIFRPATTFAFQSILIIYYNEVIVHFAFSTVSSVQLSVLAARVFRRLSLSFSGAW